MESAAVMLGSILSLCLFIFFAWLAVRVFCATGKYLSENKEPDETYGTIDPTKTPPPWV